MSFEVESKNPENEQLDTASVKSRIGKEADAAAALSRSQLRASGI